MQIDRDFLSGEIAELQERLSYHQTMAIQIQGAITAYLQTLARLETSGEVTIVNEEKEPTSANPN